MVKETKLYDLLNVSPDVNSSQLKKAYRSAALKYHPDKIGSTGGGNNNTEQATHVFQEVTTAYEILSDDRKRSIYDTYGMEGLRSSSSAVPEPSFDEKFQQAESLFDHLFGSASATDLASLFDSMSEPRTSGHGHRRMRKGRNIYHTTYCSLLDFYNGKTMKLSLTRKVKCTDCHGRGGSHVECPACMGMGTIVNETRMGMIHQRIQTTCHQCNGSGQYIPEEYICGRCHGHRLIDQKVILDINVPKGAKPGYEIVFPNDADEGFNIIPGDVVITLQEDKSRAIKNFQRRGDNLFTTVNLSLSKAVCGGLLKIEHLNGKMMKLYINRGDLANPNTIKLAKGYGMPIQSDSGIGETSYGDLVIKFNIEFPKIHELTEVQYGMLSKALDPYFKPKNISSSSSSEDVSVEDFSPFSNSNKSGSSESAATSMKGLKDPAESIEEESDDSDIVYLSDFSDSTSSNSKESDSLDDAYDRTERQKRFKST
ncbi:hypothetical protein OGAPHI_002345 [Ogataea philodendri]|uniref:Uncharacterized protein n=1 Tax=Ogataea philodendri TaxID=1378263 RepID=A0A9P8PB98_9ASCO|nr:uncharacterized protein OGAPHI_002345 [Ogataea philodendri]KAH3668591.1 hypothetical protein OGAPHI_002345 [Ogataea philodendri]